MTSPRLPVFASLHGYRRGWARGDLVAGLTVWAVLVPEALAYASIAGVSPVVGLYAAPGALIFYAAFGSSRHLVVGPMAATAALSAAAVGEVAAGHSGQFAVLTVTLALTTGMIALIAGLLRLGFVANFISEPVLKGFIVGLALTIIVGQVPKLLGVGKGSGDFFGQLWYLLVHLGDAKWLTIAAVNGSAGARTQASGLVVAALRTLYRSSSARLGRIYGFAARADFIAAVAAMLGVLVFDTLPGLIIGVADSILLLLYRVSRPHVAVLGEIPGSGGRLADLDHHPEDQTVPGVAVPRVEAGLFFANADYVRDATERAAAGGGTTSVVLDCETGQVRDMLAAVGEHGGTPECRRTVPEAVQAARAGTPTPATGEPPARRSDG